MTDDKQAQSANATIAFAYGQVVNEADPMKATEAILVKALEIHRANMAGEGEAA